MSTITEGFLDHKIFDIVSTAAQRMGVRAFVIGGYVRDCFLGRPCKDIGRRKRHRTGPGRR